MKPKSLTLTLTVIIGLISLFSLSATAQKFTKELCTQKIEQYTKLKKTGTILGITGGVLTMAGIVAVKNADWETETYDNETNVHTKDGSGILGVGAMVIGIPMTITGIVLGSVGSKKIKQYKGRLKDAALYIGPAQQNMGIQLTLKF